MISIFTPFHGTNNRFIQTTWNSFKKSKISFEWILVLNNGAIVPNEIVNDGRVKIFDLGTKNYTVGYLKKFACSKCSGDLLLELDSDDLLMPKALDVINEMKKDFFYSATIEIKEDGSPNLFGPAYGWKFGTYEKYKYNISFAPSVHSFRMVYWAPNHVRVWRRKFYERIGGHDEQLNACDDHDLLCRTYIYGDIEFYEKPLYIQRNHQDSMQIKVNALIQKETVRIYRKYLTEMIHRWCNDNKFSRINLGCGKLKMKDYINVDLENADVNTNLNEKWPFKDNSVGIIHAQDIVEHLVDPVHVMNEAYRVLVPGGWFMIAVPSTDGRGAFCDPTHKSFWNELSFRYYTNKNFVSYIPQFKGRFQESFLATELQYDLPYVYSHLIALKDDYEHIGLVHI